MVKLDKIYTRGGDAGLTSLGGGSRVKKNNLRIKAYGDLDEANSCLGISIVFSSKKIKKTLLRIQNDLFDIGADLCYPEDIKRQVSISENSINFLENELDDINKGLKKLDSFILPGGSRSSAFLHLARATVRRAERSIVELNQKEKVNPDILKYVNRLSDFLFVAARFENKKDGDILWIPNKKV
ncbi:MAG: cob(I)yrinic acid a,c-diamide adenosyltransferase [Pseudomonadota bacterium]|nr:cob(I)yrinic acid a,c-diamide adenosyltransferase [Pseudomonadota bacterium]